MVAHYCNIPYALRVRFGIYYLRAYKNDSKPRRKDAQRLLLFTLPMINLEMETVSIDKGELKFMRLSDVTITDSFFQKYYRLITEEIIPYQWNVLNDNVEGAEKSHCIENMRIAAGLSDEEFYGFLFQDSDFAKWLEAVGNCLQKGDASGFEEKVDEVVGYIEKAQEPDGYFNTYFQITAPERKFTNLFEAHELYCAGHFIEGALSYYEATGKRPAMDVACRMADMIDTRFGIEEGKIRGYDGHQEIEIALIKLYEATGNEKYLRLACFFLDERGKEPNFFLDEWEKRDGLSEWTKHKAKLPKDFSYNQAHKPVREQEVAEGHAVRAVYMYTAMADAARHTNDSGLLSACEKLFDNITQKQMYITGGIGQTNHGEAFTFDYDLPNDINYSETCASIGLIFFAQSMLKNRIDSKYSDTIELALYNTVLASMQTDGKSYFYVNPMEVVPEASEKNPARQHVKSVRQKWHACACCPTNLARLLSSLEKYIYTQKDNHIYIHQYISSKTSFSVESGTLGIEMETSYPMDAEVRINITSGSDAVIALRVPNWSHKTDFRLNGAVINPEIKNGYAYIGGHFKEGDILSACFEMKVEFIYANTLARAASGKLCVKRGPLVYCLEETDNVKNLHRLMIKKNSCAETKRDNITGFEFYRIIADGLLESDTSEGLYTASPKSLTDTKLSFVPYFLWGNRETGEMICWVRETADIHN